MSTSKEKMEYIFNQIQGSGEVRYRAMFGEYGIYFDEKFIAVVCDNHLFLKITTISHDFLDRSYEEAPYPGAKNYMKVPDEKLEDKKWLGEFLRETAENLPKKKRK